MNNVGGGDAGGGDDGDAGGGDAGEGDGDSNDEVMEMTARAIMVAFVAIAGGLGATLQAGTLPSQKVLRLRRHS